MAIASSAAARDVKCDGVLKNKTYDDVTVQRGDACTLINSTVRGDVRVLRSAYFQSTGTNVRGDVEGNKSQTIFIDTGSKVSGSVEGEVVSQFFVYNSTVGEDIEPAGSDAVVQICGNTVRKGNIEVRRSGTDILVGDPLAVGCRGNLVKRGDIDLVKNVTDVEFVVRGNTIKKGDLNVLRNTGSAPKVVENNAGGNRLSCRMNSLFSASGNTGWDRMLGQCA
jgi:hypothetical protein